MKKVKIVLTLILSFIILNIYIGSVWAVDVTEENLKTALQDFASSSENEENYDITVENNVIIIKADGKEYNVNYNLDSSPTFSVEIPVKQGMSYSEFQEEIEKISLPMVVYIAIANIQGVSLEDAAAYLGMNLLSQAFGSMSTADSKYIIVDDINSEANVNVTDNSGKEVIKASEFGNHVMEYVNYTYKDVNKMTDSTGINSYEWNIEKKDVEDTSCTIESTLKVDLSADFSKLNGYADSMGGNSSDSNSSNDTIEVGDIENNTEEENNFNWEKPDEIANKNNNLPNTGIRNSIVGLLLVAGIIVLITIIQICRYKDVK